MSRVDTVVTFNIGPARFGLEVRFVREILAIPEVCPLPNAPHHLLGLIDVRGLSIPVVDLRLLLGLPPRHDDAETRIILLSLDREGRSQNVALRVDRVTEVTNLDDEGTIAPVAESEMLDWDQRMVLGIGRRNGNFVTVLRLAGLFDPALQADLRAARAAAPPSLPTTAPAEPMAQDPAATAHSPTATPGVERGQIGDASTRVDATGNVATTSPDKPSISKDKGMAQVPPSAPPPSTGAPLTAQSAVRARAAARRAAAAAPGRGAPPKTPGTPGASHPDEVV